MTEQVGAKIKEAREAAGLTQKELAEAIDGLSASNVSRAERGLKELTEDELEAVAKATGADPESLLGAAEEEAPAAAEEPVPDAPETLSDEELLQLFKSASADTQKAAVSALKGEAQQAQNPMAAMMSMFGGMMGGGMGGGDAAAAKEDAEDDKKE